MLLIYAWFSAVKSIPLEKDNYLKVQSRTAARKLLVQCAQSSITKKRSSDTENSRDIDDGDTSEDEIEIKIFHIAPLAYCLEDWLARNHIRLNESSDDACETREGACRHWSVSQLY
jgi:hypothetical protein